MGDNTNSTTTSPGMDDTFLMDPKNVLRTSRDDKCQVLLPPTSVTKESSKNRSWIWEHYEVITSPKEKKTRKLLVNIMNS